jgi:ABC-type Fe3+-hydroxamate transport system substrate-binding protein
MPAFPLTLEDARGHTVRLDVPPRRLVSLVPSQTELLAHLGLDDETVGLTRFCERPAGWKDRKEIVGGTKNVRPEKVEALQPDLVLANLEENTQEAVEALETFAPVFVTDVQTVPDAARMIRAVGRLTDRAATADTLADRLTQRFDALEDDLTGETPLPVAYLIWRDPYMTVGRDTIIHDVMQRAGFENVFADAMRYPEVTPAELAAAGARAVLLPDEPFPFDEGYAEELREAMVRATRLPQPLPTRLVDGQLFSWYGPRLADAPAYLHRLRAELAATSPAR